MPSATVVPGSTPLGACSSRSRASVSGAQALDWAAYTPQDHDLYRRLYQRQSAQLKGLACDEFISAVANLGDPDHIPRFEALSEKLMLATGMIVAYSYATEAFIAWYSANPYERFMMVNRGNGPYSWLYWALIVAGDLLISLIRPRPKPTFSQ